MEPLIALDFDGVICDSLDECLITAYNAYHRIRGGTSWINDLSGVKPAVAGRFRQTRHLARNAPEFWLVIHWALTEKDLLDMAQFNALKPDYFDHCAAFEPVFFESRRQLQSENLSKWLALHRIYPEFLDGWEDVRGRFPIHIVTTKDLVSVQHFNRHWQLGIPDDQLWTKERRLTKAETIRQIAARSGCQPANVLFVDDHPQHVRDVASTGARCFWASWGFLGAQGNSTPEGEGVVFTKITRLADILLCLRP